MKKKTPAPFCQAYEALLKMALWTLFLIFLGAIGFFLPIYAPNLTSFLFYY